MNHETSIVKLINASFFCFLKISQNAKLPNWVCKSSKSRNRKLANSFQ